MCTQVVDAAKKRAVAQNVDYETFKNMVSVAHLKPLQAPNSVKHGGFSLSVRLLLDNTFSMSKELRLTLEGPLLASVHCAESSAPAWSFNADGSKPNMSSEEQVAAAARLLSSREVQSTPSTSGDFARWGLKWLPKQNKLICLLFLIHAPMSVSYLHGSACWTKSILG